MTTFDTELPDYVEVNRRFWDDHAAAWFGERAYRQWADEPHWGTWWIPQEQLPVLPADIAGQDVVELGCGVAYVSAWAARLGARPVGVDSSAAQLATARRLQEEFALPFPLVHAGAERVPYPDGSFDLAISEHGASTWCDPYRWIPEAARLLRPGGLLVFLRGSQLLELCVPGYDGTPPSQPAGRELLWDQFGMHRIESRVGEVRFHLPHGKMIRLLRSCGFVVEDLIEVQAPEDGTSVFSYAQLDWARRWPTDEVWVARLAG
jgi:SAM-dependent methyltransferase